MRSWTVEVDDGLGVGVVEGLDDFVAQCAEHDAHPPFDEHTLLTLQGHRQVRHARLLVRDGATVLGCCVLSEGESAWYVECAVHPTRRGRGVARALLTAASRHVASHGGGYVRCWVHENDPTVRALSSGARVSRTLLVMRRRLSGVLPVEGTRPLRDDERDGWLALSNAAFAGHPENGGWTRADLDWRVSAPWTDLSRWPVVERDGRLIAGVWTKVPPGSSTGELYVVAVDPAYQGQGLGRRVVGAALAALVEAGCTEAELYVDAQNVPAVSLYERSGFTVGRTHRCLEAHVPAALPVS